MIIWLCKRVKNWAQTGHPLGLYITAKKGGGIRLSHPWRKKKNSWSIIHHSGIACCNTFYICKCEEEEDDDSPRRISTWRRWSARGCRRWGCASGWRASCSPWFSGRGPCWSRRRTGRWRPSGWDCSSSPILAPGDLRTIELGVSLGFEAFVVLPEFFFFFNLRVLFYIIFSWVCYVWVDYGSWIYYHLCWLGAKREEK